MTDPWYKDGLSFKCTGCGQCCTGSPGYVWLTEEDIATFLNHLQIPREEFLKKYTRQVYSRLALLEDKKNYDCVFLKDNRCQVYHARPQQCRTFPWWVEHLTTPDAWKEASSRCEGINHPDSRLVPATEIDQNLS